VQKIEMPSRDKVIVPSTTSARTIDEYFQTAFDSSGCWRERWRYALVIFAISVSNAADSAELFSIGYILGDGEFQKNVLHGDISYGGAIASGIISIGLIVGGFAAALAEGHFGRKLTIVLGLFVTTLGGAICATSSTVLYFSICRFTTGLGIGAIASCCAALATELSPPRERGLIVSTANSFWTVGIIGNSIWAYLVFDVFHLGWRIYVIITLLPTIVGLILISWLVPESPRFLAMQGEFESAALSANLIATAMGYKGLLLQVSEIQHHYSDRACCSNKLRSPPLRMIKEQIHQGLSNVRNVYQGELCKPVTTIQGLWIMACIGSALAFWINTIFQKIHLHSVYLSLIFSTCFCVIGNFASALLTDRIGRNTFFTIAMTLSSASLFAFAMLMSGTENPEDWTVFIVLFTSFYFAAITGVWTVLYVMVSELFPTDVRATGSVLCSTLGRLASTLAAFMNGALIDRPTVLLSVTASVLLSAAFLSWLSPPEEMQLKAVRDRSSTFLVQIENGQSGPTESTFTSLLGNDVPRNEYQSTMDDCRSQYTQRLPI